MTAMTWPRLTDDRQWLTAALEKELLETDQTPEELTAEAQMVRGWAAEVEANGGDAKAFLMMAANIELVAAQRLAA